MPSYRRFIFFALLFFVAHITTAQTGTPMLSHYRESSEIENQSWAMCQDENNVMLFANRRGVLTFDGQGWNFIRIPVIPYSIKYNSREKKVYVGGENNYGFLQKDSKGFYRFISLVTDSARVGIISKIVFTDSTVWFYGEQSISRHELKTGKLQLRLNQKGEKPFTGIFLTPESIFINVLSKGLYRIESDTLFPIVTGYLLENTEVLFSLPYDGKLVLLGLSDGSLSLFDGIKFYPYQIKDDGYLKDNILSEGIAISDSLYAFSTLDGGAMVVNRKSGKISYAINYQNGLPDDEIFAIGSDNNNGLWLSHQYGLTRAELVLPVANLGVYPGLKGNLISSVWQNGQLYVATSEGVYYLSEVKNYTDVEIMVRQEKPDEVTSGGQSGNSGRQPGQRVQKTRKSIFSRIFGRKTTAENQVTVQTGNNQAVGTMGLTTPGYVRKKVHRLKSVDYVFRKVDRLNEKCKQLVSTSGGILVSTNKGLYVISDHSAKVIVADRYINSISNAASDNRYYISASDGYFYVTAALGVWSAGYPDRNFTQSIYSVALQGDKTLWAGGDEIIIKIQLSEKPEYHSYAIKTDYPQRFTVSYVNDTLFVFSETAVNYYDAGTDSFVKYQGIATTGGQRIEYVLSQPGSSWVKNLGEWTCIGNINRISNNDRSILKIFDNLVSLYTDDRNIWVISGENQLFKIERDRIASIKPNLDIFIRSIHNDRMLYFDLSDVIFERGDNNVYFDLVAPGYLKKNSTQYQYKINGVFKDWSRWSANSTINLVLPHGTYILKVRAKDIWGNVSEPRELRFTIKTPFTQTTFFFILLMLLALVLVVALIRFRERQLQKEKHILEEKVTERTAEIEAQKQEITSSIEYASRIQLAMLPMKELFSQAFSDHFILFKPRDIVSGDFYWIGEDRNRICFIVADCTGHGVPGAFMSTLGISTLNEIITNRPDLHANTVLNLLRTKIKNSLHQTGKEGEAADGMDVAFCILHKDRKTLEYSGAYNPLLIFQGGELKEYKADRMPIGIYVGEKESFTNFEINVNRGDIIYLFSDGIADQFGGPDGSKYKKSSLKKLLASIGSRTMEEQNRIIEDEFQKWKGDGDQIDDITVIGLKI